MNPIIKIKDGGVHIITGEDDRCECGIDVNGQARDCCEILQDMAKRFIEQYRDGRVPNGPILLCEDEVRVVPAPDLETTVSVLPVPGTVLACPTCDQAETAAAAKEESEEVPPESPS